MKKVMKKMLIAGMACVCGAALLAGCGGDSGSKSGGEKQFLNIATGGTAGTYYPLGGALAELLNNNIKGMNACPVHRSVCGKCKYAQRWFCRSGFHSE